ncbi:MAG: gamma-glutamylcyclotransferase [Parvularcula sp.]|nr:gamma-glutamylcyclotransferase [Parvularcula sp.]
MAEDVTEPTFFYFAYGSNMLTTRLRARCPSARAFGPAQAFNHQLAFSKRSHDGSGKATLAPSAEVHDVVPGVLFEIDKSDLIALDKAEEQGVGYDRFDAFNVQCVTRNQIIPHTTYIARTHIAGLMPYDWYLALIIAGAREHSLEESYVKHLTETPHKADPLPDRPSRRAALKALQEAGYVDESDVLRRR